MKRRDFLKILGVAVVAPGAVVAAVKTGPKQRVYAVNYPGSGVTNAQLQELIHATLKDLPKGMFEDAFMKSHRRQEEFRKVYVEQYFD